MKGKDKDLKPVTFRTVLNCCRKHGLLKWFQVKLGGQQSSRYELHRRVTCCAR